MSSYLFSHSIEKLGCLKLALGAFTTLRILNFLPFFVTFLLLLPAWSKWEFNSGSTSGLLEVFLAVGVLVVLSLRLDFCGLCNSFFCPKSKSHWTMYRHRHMRYKALFNSSGKYGRLFGVQLSLSVVKNFYFDHFSDKFGHLGFEPGCSNYVIIYPVIISTSGFAK